MEQLCHVNIKLHLYQSKKNITFMLKQISSNLNIKNKLVYMSTSVHLHYRSTNNANPILQFPSKKKILFYSFYHILIPIGLYLTQLTRGPTLFFTFVNTYFLQDIQHYSIQPDRLFKKYCWDVCKG